MLKGKSKIELFDAKTGKLCKCVEKENLVTNAVRNILNGISQVELAAGNDSNIKNAHNWLYSQCSTEPYKVFYGGLMVFAQQISNPTKDKIVPTADEIRSYIGGGYQGSAPTGSLLGSINSEESELGSNYAKFVWDFTTQQCNGNIACICLTSNVGGNGGLRIASSSDSGHEMGFLRPLYSQNMFNIRTNVTSVPDRSKLGTVSGPNMSSNWCAETEGGGILWSDDKVYKKPFSLDFKQSVLKNLGRPLGTQEIVYNGTLWESGLERVTCFDYDTIVAVNLSGSKSKVFNCKTAEINTYTPDFSALRDELSSVFGISLYNNTIHSKFFKNGYLYMIVFDTTPSALADKKVRLYKVNIQTGSYTSHSYTIASADLGIMVPNSTRQSSSNTAYMLEFDNNIYIDIAGTTYYTLVNLSTGDMRVVYRRYIYAAEDGKLAAKFMPLTKPWYMLGIANWSNEYGDPFLFYPYYGTINNQDVILEKDNTKTMKITYTIYEQEV